MNDQDKQQLPGKLRQPPGWLAPAVVVLLTGTFLLLSGSAVSSKSSTIDEPLHTLGAWLIKHRSDYRLNREDPPLWQHWAGLALPAGGFRANVSEELWQSTRRGVLNNQSYVVDTMSRTPGNDGEAMVQRARGLMLVLGAVLVAVTFGWARAAGGAVAGALAGALVAMDPNFLSHAALMKNDVPFTLLVAATLWTVWLCGRGITPLRCAALLIVPALAVATKFSGLVLPSVC